MSERREMPRKLLPRCKFCNSSIHRPKTPGGRWVASTIWRRRQFCDSQCHAMYKSEQCRMQWPEVDNRSCEACGKPLKRKMYSRQQPEALIYFSRRRFCDRNCARVPEGGKKRNCRYFTCPKCFSEVLKTNFE